MTCGALTNGSAAMMLERYMRDLFLPVVRMYDGLSCGFVSEGKCDVNFDDSGRRFEKFEGNVNLEWKGREFRIKRAVVCVPFAFDKNVLLLNSDLGNNPANMNDFVGTLVAVSHEYQHVRQCLVDIDRDHDSHMFAEYASHVGNESYYFQNYALWYNEAEAQYRGLSDAYEYLSALYDESEAERLILDYQAFRFDSSNDGIDFVPVSDTESGNYESIDDLFDAYESACKRLRHVHKTYDYVVGRDSGDFLGRFFWGHKPEEYEEHGSDFLRLDRYAVFNAEPDGFRQSLMVASVNPYVRLNGLGEQKYIKSVFGLDLRVGSTFRRASVMERVHRIWGDAVRGRGDIAESRFGDIVGSGADSSGIWYGK